MFGQEYDSTCTLILADGTALTGLRVNGNNYVSDTKINENIFITNLSTLTIIKDGEQTVLHNAELIQQVHYPDADPPGWHLCFRELTEEELRQPALDAAVYVARLALALEAVDTDDKRIRASGLYPDWEPGDHFKGEIYNAGGQTWECFAPYGNAVYPDVKPVEAAWYTFNRPLHGTSPETARPWVQPQYGTTDMYHAGEYMIYADGKLYLCKRDTNYSPEEYPQAWEKHNENQETNP